MGKKKTFFSRNKKKKNDGPPERKTSFKSIIKENESFVKYYKAQKIISTDEEFEIFLNTLREPLPATFRINTACFGQTQALKNIVESDEFSDVIDKDGTTNKGITKLKWYPTELAYQLNLSKTEIRESEKLLNLHGFLISETENGYVSRQETVSMIPPVLLDIKPHHKILDLCAAPGSKTSQLIEYLHSDSKNSDVNQGFVIANDINNARCYMLAHQCKRLNLPYFLITNHDAGVMPNFYSAKEDSEKEKVKFDRILADVPCTGDGTLRKNSEIWSIWTPSNGNHMYQLQLRIAKRAAELLTKSDGLMVYSTCSFNPVENVAVVMNLLREADGALELVDVEDKLKHLKHISGLENWVLMQKDCKIINKLEDVDEKFKHHFNENMFAPADIEKYNLKRCIRVLPHLQNTGGFFIAVIKKTNTLPWEKQDTDQIEQTKKEENEQDLEQKPKKPRLIYKREKRFSFITKDDSVWSKIRSFYSISDDFPSHRLLYRSEKGLNHIFYMTESAVDLLNASDNINFINFGVKIFCKIKDKAINCSHRISQDGLHILYPYLDKNKIIKINSDEFEKILKCDENLELVQLDPKTVEEFGKYPSGCVVLEYKHPIKQDDGSFKDLSLPFSVWKGARTVRPFVNKHDRVHYMRICGFDLSNMNTENERKRIFEQRQQRKTERREQRNGKEVNETDNKEIDEMDEQDLEELEKDEIAIEN